MDDNLIEKNVFGDMREVLVPKGSAGLVRLFFTHSYFTEKFVQECVDTLEKRTYSAIIGLDELNPLERLAMFVLCDSSYIKIKQYSGDKKE